MARRFVPIEAEQMSGRGYLTKDVEIYTVIRDAEIYRKRTGYGLGNVWGAIQTGDYKEARRIIEELKELDRKQGYYEW